MNLDRVCVSTWSFHTEFEQGRMDPTMVITHRMTLDEAPEGYEIFKNKQEDCLKVVLTM